MVWSICIKYIYMFIPCFSAGTGYDIGFHIVCARSNNYVYWSVPGVIGCLQALEVIKVATRIGEPLCGRMIHFDALSSRFKTVRHSILCIRCFATINWSTLWCSNTWNVLNYYVLVATWNCSWELLSHS